MPISRRQMLTKTYVALLHLHNLGNSPSIRTVKCAFACRVVIVIVAVVLVVIPAIVIKFISVIKFPIPAVVLVVITGIVVVINVVKVGVRKTSICKVVVDIILCEYSRKTGENKSGENATLDSRFCGMPKL